MKFFFALFIISFVAFVQGQLSEIQAANAEQFAKECSEEFGFGIDQVKDLKGAEITNPTDKLKCFGNCMAEKVGILKNGVLQEDTAIEKLMILYNKEKAMKILNACKDVKGTDNCDTAFQIYQCYFKNRSL